MLWGTSRSTLVTDRSPVHVRLFQVLVTIKRRHVHHSQTAFWVLAVDRRTHELVAVRALLQEMSSELASFPLPGPTAASTSATAYTSWAANLHVAEDSALPVSELPDGVACIPGVDGRFPFPGRNRVIVQVLSTFMRQWRKWIARLRKAAHLPDNVWRPAISCIMSAYRVFRIRWRWNRIV